jgi:hypothetical protein
MGRFFMRKTLIGFSSLVLTVMVTSSALAEDKIKGFMTEDGDFWRLNTSTGETSFCELPNLFVSIFSEKYGEPECSPWVGSYSESPKYKYDPKSDKLIPMNDAARKKHKWDGWTIMERKPDEKSPPPSKDLSPLPK